MNSDETTVFDINEDGIDEVIYCTDNEDFIVVNVNGELIFKNTEFPHPQKVSVGRFIEGLPGYQLFMNNRATHGGSAMLDYNGSILWEFPCNGYSSTLKLEGKDYILFKPSPGRLPEDLQDKLAKQAKELGYYDLPIRGNAGFEPFVLNGRGEILYKFPFLEESIDVTKWGINPRYKSDHGAGFSLEIVDIDNDGLNEYIFYNRRKIWVFKEE